MTLEELWELFPIFLVGHNETWNRYYDEIEALLKEALSECPIESISHIGSTAISGIWAKDIVDVLIEVSKGSDMGRTAKALEENGFILMSAKTGRVSLNRGYTKEGFAEKVFHVHLRYAGDNDELYFRDYLNEHPHVAKEYEALKLRLWKQFEHDRDAYTHAKAEFIEKWTSEEKRIYAGRCWQIPASCPEIRHDPQAEDIPHCMSNEERQEILILRAAIEQEEESSEQQADSKCEHHSLIRVEADPDQQGERNSPFHVLRLHRKADAEEVQFFVDPVEQSVGHGRYCLIAIESPHGLWEWEPREQREGKQRIDVEEQRARKEDQDARGNGLQADTYSPYREIEAAQPQVQQCKQQ